MEILVARPLLMPSTVTRSPLVDRNGTLTPDSKRWLNDLPRNLQGNVQVRFSGTHLERTDKLASDFAEGTQWTETDRKVTYVSDGMEWVYQSGMMTTTQDSLPTDLGANDHGFLALVSDYAHTLRWDGAGWAFANGEHSGYTQTFLIAPGAGWHACDGTNVVALLSDGTLSGPVTLPNTANLWFRQ